MSRLGALFGRLLGKAASPPPAATSAAARVDEALLKLAEIRGPGGVAAAAAAAGVSPPGPPPSLQPPPGPWKPLPGSGSATGPAPSAIEAVAALTSKPSAGEGAAAAPTPDPWIAATLHGLTAATLLAMPAADLRRLGSAAFSGVGMPGGKPNPTLAAQCWGAGARLNDAGALFQLGLAFMDGYGKVARDVPKALQALSIVAALKPAAAAVAPGAAPPRDASGPAWAQFVLACLLQRERLAAAIEESRGLPPGSIRLRGTRIDVGLFPPRAESSWAAHPDLVTALSMLQSAAASGLVPPAYLNLAHAYHAGLGCEPDAGAAAKWTYVAAMMGDAQGAYELASRYAAGGAVTAATAAAVAAGPAASALGVVGGSEVAATPPDWAAAFTWWRAAAQAGHPVAAFNLGCCYAAGLGVGASGKEDKNAQSAASASTVALGAQDPAAALMWFTRLTDRPEAVPRGVLLPALVNAGALLGRGRPPALPADAPRARALLHQGVALLEAAAAGGPGAPEADDGSEAGAVSSGEAPQGWPAGLPPPPAGLSLAEVHVWGALHAELAALDGRVVEVGIGGGCSSSGDALPVGLQGPAL